VLRTLGFGVEDDEGVGEAGSVVIFSDGASVGVGSVSAVSASFTSASRLAPS